MKRRKDGRRQGGNTDGGESCKRGSGAVDLNHDLWSQRSLELVSKF